MKNYRKILIEIFFIMLFGSCFGANQNDTTQQAYALYATKNFSQAKSLLESLPSSLKNEETYLILGNIAQENKDLNQAIKHYNKALSKNNEYYKAYYNLGYIFAIKKSYALAIDNFELALKYKKDFASGYYNLAYCQMQLKDYKLAKKNLLKAIELDNSNKDFYYNLIICYKKLNQTKQANKVLKFYNTLT